MTGAEVENSNTLTFKVDRTASAAPVLQSPPNGTQFLARHPGTPSAGTIDIVVAGTAELGSKIKVYDGSIQISFAGTQIADSSGNWAGSANLGVGTHTLTATATDAANNTSPPSNSATVTVHASG